MELSSEQSLILNSNEDNILILACPGSGKTHTLISKYINLIQNNIVNSNEIIMITFTKKAGLEIYNRINSILPNNMPYYIGTVHGLSYKILNEHKYYKNYIILDESEAFTYLENIITENERFENVNYKEIIDKISTTYPVNIKNYIKNTHLEKNYKTINSIYKKYQNKKKKEKLLDFNDLMVNFCKFLDNNKLNFKYVFFDEYQDINSIQNYILEKLSLTSKLMIVGDDAQSIYSFRGSDIKYILNIDNKFKKYLLTNNYRSNQSIVNFYQNIIKNNTNQHFKNINAINKDNIIPCILCFKNKNEQYKCVADKIAKQNNNSKIAILAKNNYSLDNIEVYLISKQIPITKHMGLTLLNKLHIKDFLAWISVIINFNSSIHWKRIFNLYNINLDDSIDIIKFCKDKLKSNLIDEFKIIFNNYNHIKKINNDKDKIKKIVEILKDIWKDETKINDINKLLRYLKNLSLVEFINTLYVNIEIDSSVETVYLSTIHGSKGLEWDNVYIIDMDNRIIKQTPKNYLDEFASIEEEKRLFYVGASRAKNELYITTSITISPLIKELNIENYKLINNNNLLFINYKPNLELKTDIYNYFKYNGYKEIYEYFKLLKQEDYKIHKSINFKYDKNYINNFIYKIINDNFNTNLKEFKNQNINLEVINHYNIIKKGIIRFMVELKPQNIKLNYNVKFYSVSDIINIICDDKIINIYISDYNINNIFNITQTLMHAYLLKKNNIIINNIFLYNPINGQINNFDIRYINLYKLKKIIYNNLLNSSIGKI
jgi:DNA helicase II / ATP-dependent DNA helicase PcrA